jgi:hypothetical protein
VSLKRFLMDHRVPAQERGSLPLLAAGCRVLWVPGQRIDGADAAGQRFVRLELHQPTSQLVAAVSAAADGRDS